MTDFAGTLFGRRFTDTPGLAPFIPDSTQTEYAGSFTLTGVKLGADGTLTGFFAASGTATTTSTTIIGPPVGGSPYWQQRTTTATAPFAVPATAFSVPYASGLWSATAPLPIPIAEIASGIPIDQQGAGFVSVDTPALYPRMDVGVRAGWSGSVPGASFYLTADLARSSPVYTLDMALVTDPANPTYILPWPSEGDGLVTFMPVDLLREGDLTQPASVVWNVVPTGINPASADDFWVGVLPSGIASFAPGETRARIWVPVAGDTLIENDETFAIRIPSQQGDLVRGRDSYDGFIANDEQPPTLSLTLLDTQIREGDGTAIPVSFRIDRTGNLTAATTVDWYIAGTFQRPLPAMVFEGDTFPTGHLVIPAGEASATVTVPFLGDTGGNQDRLFNVTAMAQVPGTVTLIGMESGTIHDDDGPPDPAELAVLDARTLLPIAPAPAWFNGAVLSLEKELLLLDRGDVVLVAATPNWFLHTGAGNDAIAAAGGVNVLDGGSGSNFLSGQGQESFFVDARGLAAPVWSTVLGKDFTDTLSIWIDKGSDPTVFWEDNLGAEGYRGLTLHVAQPGRPLASLTLPGRTLAETRLRTIGIETFSPNVGWYFATSSDGEQYIAVWG